MTTAIAPITAPTEAEIRRDVREMFSQEATKDDLRQFVAMMSNALDCSAFEILDGPDEREPEGIAGALWRDLRPSEAIRLRVLVDEAEARAVARCEAIIVDELAAGGLAFAAEFPDAPRGRLEASR